MGSTAVGRLGAQAVILVAIAGCATTPATSPSAATSPTGAVLPTVGPTSAGSPGAEVTPIPTRWPLITLSVNPIGQVVATSAVAVRSAPGTGPDSTILAGRLWPGMRFGILEGPVASSGYRWYRVQVGDLTGWAAAGSFHGEAWLASVRNGRIAFGAYAPANAGVEILSMAFDGTDVRQLATIPWSETMPAPATATLLPVISCGDALTPAWSSDGLWLSLVSAPNCEGVIFALRSDGSGLTRAAEGQRAAWAPTGPTLAFDLNSPYCAGPCEGQGPWDVFRINLPGGQPQRLSRGGTLDQSFNPLWSPDQALIAFTRWHGTDGRWTYVVQANGSAERRLSAGSLLGWLPDGSGVIVSREAPDSVGGRVFTVALDASQKALSGGFESFSPDGSWTLARTWDADSGEATNLIAKLGGGSEIALPADWNTLGWSPDGTALLITVEDYDLGVVNLRSLELATGVVRDIRAFRFGELASITNFAVQPLLVGDLN